MKIMVIFFKRPHACTAILSTPSPAAGHHQPKPLPETPGHLRASLGQCLVGSLLLSPGPWCSQSSVCALQEFVSQSCVSSGHPVVGLMDTSFKRAYAILGSTIPRAPAPVADHCWPIPPQETLKHKRLSYWVKSGRQRRRNIWHSLYEESKKKLYKWTYETERDSQT